MLICHVVSASLSKESIYTTYSRQGCGVKVARSRRLLGRVGFFRTLGVGVGDGFLSDSVSPIDIALLS